MESSFELIENVIPFYIQDYLEEGCINGKLNFKFYSSTLNTNNYDTQKYSEGEQWVSNIQENLNTDLSHYYLLPLQLTCIKLGIDFTYNNLTRVKLNLKYPNNQNLPNPPHIDFPLDKNENKGIVIIYYVNNSDGDTILYKGNNPNNLTPFQNITPKKGNVLIMKGNVWHSASHPTKEKRIVINYNLEF